MLITQSYSWSAVSWPTATTLASQYAIFQLVPTLASTQSNPVQIVTTPAVTLSYDDAQSFLFQVRPTDGVNYGPECFVIVVNFIPCRAYIRQRVRYALNDVLSSTNTVPKWSDEEINGYINEAIAEVSVLFPQESEVIIPLLPMTVDANGNPIGVRSYALPSDCLFVRSVAYVYQGAGNLHLWLKQKPFRGGESTADSYVGLPKLGILISPAAGRFYPGHYDVWEQTLFIDWDPDGTGDELHVRYLARYPIPTDDSTVLTIPQEDLELISLRTQVKCWLKYEGQDVSLSRFIENKKRDDLPTERMSARIQKLYDQLVNDRRERRPRTYRLVRR